MMKPKRVMPYQLGVWLAEYGRSLCHACQVFHSNPMVGHKLQELRYQTDESKVYGLKEIFYKGLLCERCHKDNEWLPQPFKIELNGATLNEAKPKDTKINDANQINNPAQVFNLQAASTYGSIIKKALVAFKYHEDLTALPILVYAIRLLPKPIGCNKGNSIILPMPTTQKRLLKRGFDPVTIFSYYLSKHWQIPIAPNYVRRIDDTVSQQGLNREERLNNIQNAFALNQTFTVDNILLFDDVATTGASLKSLANCINNVRYPTNLSAYAIAHGNYV